MTKLWTITVPKGATIEGAWAECQKLFSCWRSSYYTDFDKQVTSDRDTKEGYTVSFKATVEADPNLKNLSADDLKEKGIKGITLLERLLLEIQYFKKTGKHLDVENWTLCSGSRLDGGGVPDVRWLSVSRAVYVGYYDPRDRHDLLRCREVVSLSPSSSIPSRDKNGRFAPKTEEWEKVQAVVEELRPVVTTIRYKGRIYKLEGGE